MRRFASSGLVLALETGAIVSGCAERRMQSTYATPDQAVDALVAAVRSDDPNELRGVLGEDAEKLISSGDEVADRNARERFIAKYEAKHSLSSDGGTVTLVVGDNDWPMPIPIVRDPGSGWWRFDAAAGEDEIICRRIGRNELATISVCKAIVDAEREYAMKDPDNDAIRTYARQFQSDPGKRDGLYWPSEEGEEPSPLGAVVAKAASEGYAGAPTSDGGGTGEPYHGYLFRILTRQGPHAAGGARDYMINGKLIGGFGLVAYPAEYGNSGVMTFLTNQDGVVYQQDMGPGTRSKALAISEFDPGPGWERAEEAK